MSAAAVAKAAKKPYANIALQDNQEATDQEDNDLLYENQVVVAAAEQRQQQQQQLSPSKRRTLGAFSILPSSTNDQITSSSGTAAAAVAAAAPGNKLEAWKKSPLTTPTTTTTTAYASLTVENLKDSAKAAMSTSFALEPRTAVTTAAAVATATNRFAAWGGLGLNHPADNSSSSTPASSDKGSQQSYGASMYTKTQAYQEIDSFHQKARRSASLDNTCVDIDNYVNGANKIKGVKVPNFKPAEGCRNASDFVVRCFSARLRIGGFTVLKHNRSRWSKAKDRVIYLLPDGKTLTWREPDDEKEKETDEKTKSKRPKIDLTNCVEIRHAWSLDPTTKNKRGTPVLRSRCKEGLAGKSFSLIFGKRTLDFTAFSSDQCKVLMEGFSALCFRLQLQKLEDKEDHSSRMPISEDDWASTIYGGSTTESASLTNTAGSAPIASTPWGR